MKGNDLPAILGGAPEFKEFLPIVRPTLPSFAAIKKDLEIVLKSGIITNSSYVAKWEEIVKQYTGVKNAVVLANCTSGLILTLQYFKMKGSVLLPSFTFSATGHSIVWNGLKPKFVDCDPEKFTMDHLGPQRRAVAAHGLEGPLRATG
jgi:dTDP-4-amino-4,6-dideoxygalactose transaminase